MSNTLVLEYAQPRTNRRFYYGWVNLVIAALAMVATLPGRPQGLGMITEPLMKSLHISPIQFASFNGWATLIGSTFCLACGPLLDRFGARVMLVATLAALGATVLAMTRVVGPTGLLITLILSRGFGQSTLAVVSLALVGKWFSRRLPLAMGIFATVSGLGFGAAFKIVGVCAIRVGWLAAWAAIGWSLLGLMVLALLLVRRSPESIGLVVDGSGDASDIPASNDDSNTGFTLAQALASPAFWAYALAASTFGMISAGLMLFNESVLKEHGFDRYMAVDVLVIVMLTGLVANIVAGLLGGKWPVGRLMACGMFLLTFSLLSLPLVHGKAGVYGYSVLIGVAGGFVTVAFYACWGKVFGRLHLGSIQGAAQGLTVITSSAGPILLAQCVHHTGSSQLLFYTLAPVVALLGIFCALAPVPKLIRGTGFQPVIPD